MEYWRKKLTCKTQTHDYHFHTLDFDSRTTANEVLMIVMFALIGMLVDEHAVLFYSRFYSLLAYKLEEKKERQEAGGKRDKGGRERGRDEKRNVERKIAS